MEKTKNLNMQNKDYNMDVINNTVKKLHKNNKNDVPVYLNNLKENKNSECKKATYDNEFIKYML